MKAVDLLDQIINHEEHEERHRKAMSMLKGKGEEAVGESWTIFHLKRLKELLSDEEAKE